MNKHNIGYKLIRGISGPVNANKYYFLMIFVLFAGFVAIELVSSYSILSDEKLFLTDNLKRFVKCILFASLSCGGLIMPVMIIITNKRFYISLVVLTLFSLFVLANLLHVRVFCRVISLSMYTYTGNLNGLWNSIAGLFKVYDILYLIIPVGVIAVYSCIKHKIEIVAIRKCLLTAIIMFCVYIASFAGYLSTLELEGDAKKSSIIEPLLVYNDLLPKEFYCDYGCLNSFIAEAMNCYIASKRICTEENRAEIESYLSTISPVFIPEEKPIVPVKKNLIILLIESLNSKALEVTIGGQYVMPNMAGLVRDKQTLVSNRTKHPEQIGMSISGQFNILTGLIALHDDVFISGYPRNTYPSIIKAIRNKYGELSSTTLVPTNRNFWGQDLVDVTVGVDSLFGQHEIGQGEGQVSDKWLSDQRIFQYAMVKLKQKKDNPFYMLVVTSDMHGPYDEVPVCDFIFPEGYPEALRAYYSRAHNVDNYIGTFIDSLKKLDGGRVYEESLIVISADHNIVMAYMDGIRMNEDMNDNESLSYYTPMLFVNTGYDMRATNKAIEEYDFVQEQAYPTMLSLLNLSESKYSGLFPSILDMEGCKQFDFSNVSRSTPNQKLQKAFNISELIIRNNYFK